MKFGLSVINFGEYFNPHIVADLALDAEKAGWDGFFLWDHLLMFKDFSVPVNDPWVTLAAIAVKTTKIKIGALITPIPRRRPWKLARETVSIDHLSNGRLIFGAGLGAPPDTEFEYFGEESNPRVRAKKLDEGLDILTGLWSGKPFKYTGEYFNLKEMTFLPVPLQSPRIPIWIGGMWPNKAPFRRAARYDGVIPEIKPGDKMFIPITPQDIPDILEYINQVRTRTRPYDVVVGGETPGDDPEKGAEIIASFSKVGVTWWLEDINGLRGTFNEMHQRIKQGPPKG